MTNYTGVLLLHATASGAGVVYEYDWINGVLVAAPKRAHVAGAYTPLPDEPPCFALERDSEPDSETQPLDVEALNAVLRRGENDGN